MKRVVPSIFVLAQVRFVSTHEVVGHSIDVAASRRSG